MRLRLLLFILLIYQYGNSQSTFYSFKLDSLEGGKIIDFAAFRGKNILIVNTASGDTAAGQYNELIQLKQLYMDSLIIVAVPTNSFDSETGVTGALNAFYVQNANWHFPVSARLSVAGNSTNELFQWLSQASRNKIMDAKVLTPFQKYLINRRGELVGVYSAHIRPLSVELRNAIKNAYQ